MTDQFWCHKCNRGPTTPLNNYDAWRCNCGYRIWSGQELAEGRRQ